MRKSILRCLWKASLVTVLVKKSTNHLIEVKTLKDNSTKYKMYDFWPTKYQKIKAKYVFSLFLLWPVMMP